MRINKQFIMALFFCKYMPIKGVIILFVAKIDLAESIYITSFTPSTQTPKKKICFQDRPT